MRNNQETVRFDDVRWISPVDTIDDLPMDVTGKGLLCYVQTEDAIYQFTNGIWIKGADLNASPGTGSLPS